MKHLLILLMVFSLPAFAQFKKKPAIYFTNQKTGETRTYLVFNYCHIKLKNAPQNDSLFPKPLDEQKKHYYLLLQSQIGEVLVFENGLLIPYSEIEILFMPDNKTFWRNAPIVLMFSGVSLILAYTYNKMDITASLLGLFLIYKQLLIANKEAIETNFWELEKQQVPEVLFKVNPNLKLKKLPPLQERYNTFKN